MNEEQNTDLIAVYMINGLIYVGEGSPSSSNAGVSITRPLAFAVGQQQGQMAMLEAFPFSDVTGTFILERSGIVTVAEVDDKVVKSKYEDAIKKLRAAKSGLVLP